MPASRAILLGPVVLGLVIVVLAAGCGSSSHKTTTAAAPLLTQKQFVAAGNGVCIKSDRRVFQLGRLTLLPEGWAKTAAAARIGIAQMAALHPPVADEPGFRRMLALGDKLAAGIQRVHDALVKKNYKAAEAEQLAATNADTAIHRQAKTLGLTFCQQLLTNWPA